ncbi:SGNH/GDSL hydrolase family protein [Weissella hellenica]|nr:SGNH/GDSL hydrolase family protein [Weissella hellenica]
MLIIRLLLILLASFFVFNLECEVVRAYEGRLVNANYKKGLEINEGNKNCSNLVELAYFKDENIWIIGDSLMIGWDGNRVVSNSCPNIVRRLLQPNSLNDCYSFSGAQISGNRATKPVDLTNNVTNIINDAEFKSADYLLIALGVNDLNYSDNNIGYVQQRLQSNIYRLKQANPNLKIMGSVPFDSYLQKKASDYTLKDLQDALKATFNSFGIPIINWQQSPFAYSQYSLNDGVHPKTDVYQQMGYAISNFIVHNRNMTQNIDDKNSTLFLSNGWQTNELGDRQYAHNNILLVDWQLIDGVWYYFDPKTKAIKK